MPWWQTAVFYQIYPRSFLDTNGDGVGDLEGIRRRLDHLVWLGVDALWISPFFRSPMKDYGYDVSDYCDVDPLFGTLADFDRLLAEAKARGLRVIIDWVPNHTSDQHPWFREARASRHSGKRDWYIWRDGSPERPPNNWRAAFTKGPAWTWDEATRQWYLHLFLPEQPDLNWANPDVVAAMHDTLRFWLARGVDGFRMDVIHAIGKDPALPDVPAERAIIPACALNDVESTHGLLRAIRGVLEEFPGERVMVGEVAVPWTEVVARYYGYGDELHLAFNFPPIFAAWEAGAWREQVDRAARELDPRGAWPTWVLSNHDNRRHRSRYGSEARARAAAVLLLGLRGTPFLYAGEELGLEDAVVPAERALDPEPEGAVPTAVVRARNRPVQGSRLGTHARPRHTSTGLRPEALARETIGGAPGGLLHGTTRSCGGNLLQRVGCLARSNCTQCVAGCLGDGCRIRAAQTRQ